MIRISNAVRNAWNAANVFGLPDAIMIHWLKARRSKTATRVKVKDLPGGLWMRPHGTDLQVAMQTWYECEYGLNWCKPYQDHILGLCQQAHVAGDTPLIIDVGANIGASTLLFAKSFPGCQVFAIEPDPENFAMLEKNTANRPNITPVHAALWDKPINLSMLWPGTGWGCRVREGMSGNAAFPGITIPDLLAHDRRLRPIIVKIDIEGAEVSALRGDTGWVDQVPLMIFEQHDNLWHWLGPWQGSGDAFHQVLHRKKREYLRSNRSENDYAFLHPEAIEAAAVNSM